MEIILVLVFGYIGLVVAVTVIGTAVKELIELVNKVFRGDLK